MKRRVVVAAAPVVVKMAEGSREVLVEASLPLNVVAAEAERLFALTAGGVSWPAGDQALVSLGFGHSEPAVAALLPLDVPVGFPIRPFQESDEQRKNR